MGVWGFKPQRGPGAEPLAFFSSLLNGIAAVAADVTGAISSRGFSALPIGVQHGQAGDLPGAHRDPFDRMVIAQALLENLLLVSNDTLFDGFGVRRLW